MIISDPKELIALTGETRKSKQIAALRAHRIPFFVNAKGRPVLIKSRVDYGIAKRLFASAKSGAKTRKLDFNLTFEDVTEMMQRANDKCEFTGLPFSFDKKKEWRRSPWRPSIDRIDSSKGYSPDNCRLICLAVNIAINEWGPESLMMIAKAMNERIFLAND